MKKRSILLAIVFFISIIILSVNSNKKYLVNEEFLATYIDGEKTDSFPAKGTVSFSKAECDNNTNIEWDNDNWGLYVTNLSNKVKCNIYFKTGENAVTKITSLASSDTTNMASDDPDNNIRYIGTNPNNYVYFNCSDYANQTSDTCELWRIIGVFNNIEKEDGTKENLIKIIRNESIGSYSWDTTTKDNNSGYGYNYWNNSKLMKLLNPGYELTSIGGSLYYNSISGQCYYSQNNSSTSCNFEANGLKAGVTKKAIVSAYWKIGCVTSTQYRENGQAYNWYEYERKNDACFSNSNSWTGKVAILYASDYGFATGGGTTTNRNTCLNTSMYNWNEKPDCFNNNWLYGNTKWLLAQYSAYNYVTFAIYDYNSTVGQVSIDGVGNLASVNPVLFLKSNILITSGDGSSNTPYQLGL